jgi:aminoglycoside phosphotransferase family enzyme
MDAEGVTRESGAIGTETKVAFLGDPQAYSGRPQNIESHETHMSWVFIGDQYVHKLKKPVRFSYLDFSSIERREAACRTELRLNQRLAPSVYLDVVPLVWTIEGLSLGGQGEIVDWLVVMRRLDRSRMLENILRDGPLDAGLLERLADILATFYRRASRSLVSPAAHLGQWRRRIAENRHVLSDRRLPLDFATLARIDRAQRRFVTECADLLAERVKQRRIIEGHGDLRPEHIWLGESIAIIDCLEFSQPLRTIDPFDELAFLSIECDRLGAGWVGRTLGERLGLRLRDRISAPLLAFYRCYRATTRARLALAHLLEPDPRTPEKWPLQARAYLALALRDVGVLECHLAEGRRRRKIA